MSKIEEVALLILSRKSDKTVEHILPELNRHQVPWIWWDPGSIPTQSCMGFQWNNNKWQGALDTTAIINLSPDLKSAVNHSKLSVSLGTDIGAVWYRRPTKEHAPWDTPNDDMIEFINTEVNWFMKSFYTAGIVPVVCNPIQGQKASARTLQLAVAQQCGFKIPETYIGNNPEEIRAFWKKCNGKTIIKAIQNSVAVDINGNERGLFTSRVYKKDLEHENKLHACPCIYQKEIPKDFEIRATVVGQEVHAVEIHSQQSSYTKMDWRNYDLDHTPHYVHQLPKKINRHCLDLVKQLHLLYGAIDLIVTPEGDYVFLEINPFGQWGWLEDLTDIPISAAHVRLFQDLLQYPEKWNYPLWVNKPAHAE
ncbi:MAG: hypothetical protein FH748_14030 [Balneolaceae bacterium]|nr:hypothetical protein [Balneolaceae bacterium]